jgi:putative transposase
MSRLRRPYLYDRYIFVTVNLLKVRRNLEEGDFRCLARSIERMRASHGFALTAWVFLPDHWHAILYPRYPLSISRALKAIKVSSMIAINGRRGEAGELWQGRFFDHALRTVKDYMETVEYIHLNPVRRGLVMHPGEWKWSSYSEYAGTEAQEQDKRCGVAIDRVRLPSNPRTRI